MLAVLVLIWLGAAVVSLGPGFDWGLQISAGAGLQGGVAKGLVVGGALLDAVLGVGLLLRRWRAWALPAQLGLTLGYTLLVTWLLPHLWADPLMAVGKNAALTLVTLWLLLTELGKEPCR